MVPEIRHSRKPAFFNSDTLTIVLIEILNRVNVNRLENYSFAFQGKVPYHYHQTRVNFVLNKDIFMHSPHNGLNVDCHYNFRSPASSILPKISLTKLRLQDFVQIN